MTFPFLTYAKVGIVLVTLATLGGLYVAWRSAAADAQEAKSRLAQARHSVEQLRASAAQAAEAARKAQDAQVAASGVLAQAEATNAALAQRVQDLMASASPDQKLCLAMPLAKDIRDALPH